jgi:signal transduction histidine kinase
VNRTGVSAGVRVTVAAVGIGAVVTSLVVAGNAPETTYGGESRWFAATEAVAALALLASGLLLLVERGTALLGAFALLAAVVWLAPLWVGWQSGSGSMRSIGLALAPLLAAVLLALTVLIPPVAPGLVRQLVVAVVGLIVLAAGALSVALVVVRDPIRDLYCWSDCTVPSVLGHDSIELTHRYTTALLRLNTGIGVAVALVALFGVLRASGATRRAVGPAFMAAALAGLAVAAYSAALLAEPRERTDRPLFEWLFLARGLALLALAAGLAWIGIRHRLIRSQVTRLAVDLERSAAEGALARLLASALGDPALRLLYPIAGGERVVDSEGRPVEIDNGRKGLTPLLGDEGVLALLETSATSVEALERELGPAAQLALGNERLRAEALAHLADVTESRARIVETSDAARRRMERDLHDAAQQRMLALTYDLRVAVDLARSEGREAAVERLDIAQQRAVVAAQELRDVAHGIFPSELTTSGLEAALESLADVRPLRLTIDLPAGRRYRPDVETASYAVVVEALDAADARGDVVSVVVAERDAGVDLRADGVRHWGERLVHVEDRVRAAGGTLTAGEATVRVHLPSDRGVSPRR